MIWCPKCQKNVVTLRSRLRTAKDDGTLGFYDETMCGECGFTLSTETNLEPPPPDAP